MTPSQALHALETILAMLERLLPGFRGTLDHADLTEARAALEDMRARLARQLVEEAR